MLSGSEKRAPKFLTGSENESRRRAYKKHERKVAKSFQGVETVGSGNKGMKGDAWGGDRDAGQRFMIECKSTKHRSISVKLEWLEKLELESFQAGMEGILTLRFEATKTGAKDFAVVPLHRLQELLEMEARLNKDGGT